MISSLQATGVRIRGFSGLRSCNALDTVVRPRNDIHSLVASIMSCRRQRTSRCVPKAMFKSFTEKDIKVIMLTQEKSRGLGHPFVGTEQILLGLIREGTGIAARVFRTRRIYLKDARVRAKEIIGQGSVSAAVQLLFTPRAKCALELSLEEARHLSIVYACLFLQFT